MEVEQGGNLAEVAAGAPRAALEAAVGVGRFE
eukprot:CAMPEP_0171794682 /NCGR_PEP_ID=MMETSP0991-20121206/68281_1 /TAXON_ID=483369 /ORGANISM="non described non described, Strain CCMP2098" /LENGTH=31 /DNA_ID= /DNA_START= /DNA_END= /DNA_ORIENTATION=